MKLFTNKKLRYGTYSVVMTLVVLAVMAAVNLLVSKLDYTFDLSANQLYSLDEKTTEVLDALNESVTIYPLFATGQTDETFQEIITLYENASKHIKIDYRDPYLYPNFAKQYYAEGDLSVGSIIVESERRFRVIPYEDLINYTYTQDFQQQAESIDIEPRITSAVVYVTMTQIPKIYNIANHSEQPLPQSLLDGLQTANFAIEDLDIFNQTELPEDCDVLLLQTPRRDYTPEETALVSDFLANDGRAIFLTNYALSPVPNFNSLLSGYGIGLSNKILVEGDPARMFQNNGTVILPVLETHEINEPLIGEQANVLLYQAQMLTELELKKPSTSIEPLLTSSAQSYAAQAENESILSKRPEDEEGPLVAAVAITDSYYTDTNHLTKIVAIGSALFIDPQVDMYVSGSNTDFVMHCIGYLFDEQTDVLIAPKNLAVQSILLTGQDVGRIAFISCVVLPAAILLIGLFIWLRRRNK